MTAGYLVQIMANDDIDATQEDVLRGRNLIF